METPSSTRRVTRSQTLAASANKSNSILSGKVEKSRQRTATKQQDRSPLIDITNDSPIVGIAMGNLETPSSAVSKKVARSPGSGEALLRCQVKTLLQKVEEEAEMSRIPLQDRPFFRHLVVPTPVNTPQVLTLSAGLTPSPVMEKFPIPPVFDEEKEEEFVGEDLITRSLMLDFNEKLDSSDQDLIHSRETDDDDDTSNAGDEEEEDGSLDEHDEEDDFVEDGDGLDDDRDTLINGLCEGISNMSVERGLKFSGKHIRFVYNSDDELQGEEQVF